MQKVFLFAGEQSGDVLGSKLVHALKTQNPSLDLYGVGGSGMEAAGLRVTCPMSRFQVMGFYDVIKAFPRLAQDFRKIKKEILSTKPAGVIFIDYPDFNMLMAKALRRAGYQGKLIHYVCPSVWAWRKNRVKTLSKTLDLLLSILPFEGKYFAHTQLPVTFIGHPLVAAIDTYNYSPTVFPKPLIAIFPGSRRHEIELNLPLQLNAAKEFLPQYTLAVSVARPDLEPLISSYTDNKTLLVPAEQRYELMKASQGALATSGTIILELGLHSVPTVATYKLSTFNYLLVRHALNKRLPYYTLVNIICDNEVYPEFIHKDLSPPQIAATLRTLMAHPEAIHNECARLRTLLQKHDASQKAAQTILRTLS